jgi:hypothetical protein
MKKSFYVSALACCVAGLVFSVSCSKKYPTFEELKSAETKEIRRIIEDKGIEVIKEYPASGVFGENQFVELSSGIYLNVVDSGNGNRAKLSATTILIRTELEYYDGTDSVRTFSSFSNTSYPFEFKYGYGYSVVSAHSQYEDLYAYFFSVGLESILSYVGEGAEVKLIVPGYSEINSVAGGSIYQTSNNYRYIPIYYKRVKYTFY